MHPLKKGINIICNGLLFFELKPGQLRKCCLDDTRNCRPFPHGFTVLTNRLWWGKFPAFSRTTNFDKVPPPSGCWSLTQFRKLSQWHNCHLSNSLWRKTDGVILKFSIYIFCCWLFSHTADKIKGSHASLLHAESINVNMDNVGSNSKV